MISTMVMAREKGVNLVYQLFASNENLHNPFRKFIPHRMKTIPEIYKLF